MQQTYGASPEDWITFDVILGLTQDLLPVVSNPEAEISPASTLRAKGKVPSRYNGSHKVSGIENWTSHKATGNEIVRWSKEPDYGICIQTRHVRALDIDVTDEAASYGISSFLHERYAFLPQRSRENSAKTLFAFRLPGEYPKRILKCKQGIIEFLANGQQFIAAGTHPSGARYEWEGLTDFPELTAQQFEELWTGLVERFGVGEPFTARPRLAGEDLLLDDPVLDKLTVLGWGSQGQAHIDCPFAHEHTTPSSESSTSYFPAGTRGYEQGHFVCLHAHCAERSDVEFLDALGIRAADFESIIDPVDETAGEAQVPAVWPAFKRDKSGEIQPVLDNLYHALKRDDVCEARIAYDRFRDEVVITSAKAHALAWRPFTDNDYTVLQRHLEREIGFKPITLDLLRRTVRMVAHENSFDSATLWLEGLTWDGIPRVDAFMSRYLKAEGNAYARAVSRYLWTALAGRVLVPGVKADMILILEGKQGTFKSSTVSALSPAPEFFCKISFDEKEDNISRKIRGKLIAEIAELRGLKTKALEAIKDFVTSTHENWIPKYQEHSVTLPRRLVFIATTNDKEVLDDSTGNRRWLPVHVESADLEALMRDRDQLWAEGMGLFRKFGVCYQEAEKLALGVHSEFAAYHPWEEVILEWLETPDSIDGARPMDKGYVTTNEVMQQAVHLETKNLKGNDAREIGKVLRKHGYENVVDRVGKKAQRIWRKVEEGV